MACHGFQWWGIPLWGGKEKERVHNLSSKGSSPNSSSGYNSHGWSVRESDSVKFPLKKGVSSPRRIKKKWHSREERRIDREHDIVVVPNDGVSLSESESEDSDWSIGWLEPHGHDFLSDDETDDSFAVLVPCYRNNVRGRVGEPSSQLLNVIQHVTNEHFSEGKNLMDQWLSSLRHF
ncbi:hypothetical protein RND81_13G217000 [Saponaria officinalis]|uniref:Uncharacterized protein n=1 Tax=Saponaria officinalis TaxID=3572 RepID=A0AAW1H3E3_SAPOF